MIAPRFGDIFRNNSTKAGLLPVVLPEKVVGADPGRGRGRPPAQVTVDLDGREVRVSAAASPRTWWSRSRSTTTPAGGCMEGLDDIGLTLRHEDAIAAFEATRPSFLPATL